MGAVKNRLGSSIAYYQAQQQNFWAVQEAWEQTPKALPLPKLVKMANFADFQTKIAEFFMFFKKNSPTKNFVLDLVGLTERFSGIPIGRIQFYKILASKTGKFDI